MHKGILNEIANILFVNVQTVKSDGLIKGKLGIALFFYEYARYTGNKMYSDFADEYIETMYYKLRKDLPVDLINGLTGKGWCIHYLIEKKFIEVDEDEDILEEMDTLICKMDQQSFHKETELEIPIFSKGLYFLQRGNTEILKNIVYECDEFLSSNTKAPLSYLNSIFYFINRIAELDLLQDIHKPLFDKLFTLINNQINQGNIESTDLNILHRNIYHIPYTDLKKQFEEIEFTFEKNLLTSGFIHLIYPYKNDKEPMHFKSSDIQFTINQLSQNINEKSLFIYNGLAGLGLELLQFSHNDT